MKPTIVVGTRGSHLSLRQVDEVLELVKPLHPWVEFKVRIVSSHGDRDKVSPIARFGTKGIFTRELEDRLRDGDIDIAIHSLKDMPSEDSPGFSIAAVPPRHEPRDVLVSKENLRLEELPSGARLGTGSPRRMVQIRAARPDLQVLDIRGNVDTRIGKVRDGQYDGAVLAGAGLLRMGWKDQISEYLSVDICLPAVGQGALAVQARAEDAETISIVETIDDPTTRRAVETERAVLRQFGGGCLVPIAAYACYEGRGIRLRGMVGDPGSCRVLRAEVEGRDEPPEELAAMLVAKLRAMGAAEIVGAYGR